MAQAGLEFKPMVWGGVKPREHVFNHGWTPMNTDTGIDYY
jgi:hypothetical protein